MFVFVKNSNNKVTLTCYSDIIANRNLGCGNALAQRFRIALLIRSYFRGLFCLPEDGNLNVSEISCYIFYLGQKTTEHLQIMIISKFIYWALN
jgi:hypothetical protein